MNPQFIIGVFALLVIVTNAEKCAQTKIGNNFFKRQLIATIDGHPTGMTIDPRTEHMFFILHKKNYTKGIHLLKHGSLKIEPLPIADELIGQCIAVDVPNNVIYIGTNRGLVTYDYSTTEITGNERIGDNDVRNIFIDKTDNEIYIITGSNHEIFKFTNNSAEVERYETIPKANSFIQDAKKDVFYEYVDGRLYFFSIYYFEPIQYKGFTRSLKYVLQLNNHDEVILAVKGSLYKLTTKHILPDKIGQLGFKITAIAFDSKNNMVVGTKGKIFRYKHNDIKEPCVSDDYILSTI